MSANTLSALPPATNASRAIPGLYIVKLVSVWDAGKSQFANETTGEYDDQAGFRWEIVKVLDTEANDPAALVGTTITRYCKMTMGPRSNMRLFAEAHLGRKLEDAEQLDVDKILNTYAKMSVAQKQGQRGMETHVTMSPHKKEKSAPAPPPLPAVEDDDEDPF